MKSKKATKRALLSSALSLVLCFSMLLGTTFAWFTDTASTAVNTIQAGKLEVQLLDENGASLEGEPLVFKKATGGENQEILWEPGVTYHTQGFQIKNNGDLYLKFQMVVNGVTNGSAKLLEAIDFYVTSDVNAAMDTWTELSDFAAKEFKLAPGNSYAGENSPEGEATGTTLYLVGHMKEEAGNEYQEETIGGVGITVYATQVEAEFDSFDNKYDEDSKYSVDVETADELIAALEQGKSVKLVADIEKANTIKVPEGVDVVIDLAGHSLNAATNAADETKHYYAIENYGTLTLMNGTVNARGVGNYGNLTIESGTYNAIDTNGGGAVWNYTGGSVTINGGTFTAADDAEAPGAVCLNVAANSTAVINGGTFVAQADQTYAIISNGTLTINDITATSDHGVVSSSGTTEINGGSFTQNGNLVQTSNSVYVSAGTTTINGGNFVHNEGGKLDSGDTVVSMGGNVVITDGNFSGGVTGDLAEWNGADKITVSGGTFSSNPSGYVATGYLVTENGNGTWTVSVDKENVATAGALADALKTSGDVTVTGDVALTETAVIAEDAEVTMNLDTQTVSGEIHKSVGHVLDNDGNLTITGGTISSTAANGGSAIRNDGTLTVTGTTLNGAPKEGESWPSYTVNNTGTMTVKDATVTSVHGALSCYGEGAVLTLENVTLEMSGISGFTSHGIYTYNGGKVIIMSGTYTNSADDQSSTGGSVVNGNVEIFGGTFVGRIENYYGTPVIHAGTFSVDPTKYVAEGSSVTNNDGTWTVVSSGN